MLGDVFKYQLGPSFVPWMHFVDSPNGLRRSQSVQYQGTQWRCNHNSRRDRSGGCGQLTRHAWSHDVRLRMQDAIQEGRQGLEALSLLLCVLPEIVDAPYAPDDVTDAALCMVGAHTSTREQRARGAP